MPNAMSRTCVCESATVRLFARLSETRIMFNRTSPSFPMASESVSRLLDENADLKPLATRLAYIRRLQRRYRSLAPEHLAEASRVCAIDGTTVVICATSGPVAQITTDVPSMAHTRSEEHTSELQSPDHLV